MFAVSINHSVCDSLRIALSFEFYSYLLETKQIPSEIIIKIDDSPITKIMSLMDDFIEKHTADDQVFQKKRRFIKCC